LQLAKNEKVEVNWLWSPTWVAVGLYGLAPQYANELNLIPKMMTFLFAPENGIIIIAIRS
jgi:hypothetical protein